MIKVKFFKKDNSFTKFEINGHAESAQYGEDLVCAGVTAIVSGSLNAFDQAASKDVAIKVLDNQITVEVIKNNEVIQIMFTMLFNQLKTIEIQYTENVEIKEVL